MSWFKSSAAALGRLALAAAFDGPALAQLKPVRNDETSSRHDPAGRLKTGWSLPETAALAAVAAGWLSERRTLREQGLGREAEAVVSAKDWLIVGAVATGIACLIGEEVLKRRFDGAIPVTAGGELAPNAPKEANGYRRYLRLAGALNRVCVAGAVAATPFINFALFNDYRPHPVRSFFSL